MGALAIPLAIGFGTAGVGYMLSRQMAKGMNAGNMSTAALTNMSNQMNQDALETLPEVPDTPTGDGKDAETNSSEAERQAQIAALEENEKAMNPTSGLGVTSKAKTKKRSLGGI